MPNTPSESSSITFQNNLPTRLLPNQYFVTFSVNGVEQCNLRIGEQKTILLEPGKHLLQAQIDYTCDTKVLFLELESSKNSLISLEAEWRLSWISYYLSFAFLFYPKYSSQLILKKVHSNNILSPSDRANGKLKKPGDSQNIFVSDIGKIRKIRKNKSIVPVRKK